MATSTLTEERFECSLTGAIKAACPAGRVTGSYRTSTDDRVSLAIKPATEVMEGLASRGAGQPAIAHFARWGRAANCHAKPDSPRPLEGA